MNNMGKFQHLEKIVISNEKSILDHHSRAFNGTPVDICRNTEQMEWQCLLNTLKKNLYMLSLNHFLTYPYEIIKRERPDFEVCYSNGSKFYIEITRATTMKNEALKDQMSKGGNSVKFAEVSNDQFTNAKPKKNEMAKNLVRKGEALQGTGMYGQYAEIQWAKIVAKAIMTKSQKGYAKIVSMLLIEDRSLPYAYREAIEDRFKYLRLEIEGSASLLSTCSFPNIVTDTSGTLGLIRIDSKWLFEPLILPEGWMSF